MCFSVKLIAQITLENALTQLFAKLFVICSWQVSDVGSLFLRQKEIKKKS